MADVVLIQPKIGIESFSSFGLVPPWGLIYSSVYLAGEFDVKIIDQRLDYNWRETLQKELDKNPICVGVASKVGYLLDNALEISKFIRLNSKAPIVWGGAFASMMYKTVLSDECVDIIISGEGELTFYELVKTLEKGGDLAEVSGIGYLKNDKPFLTPCRDFVDLNALPPLPLHLIHFEDYVLEFEGHKTLYLVSSRGCPRSCNYCYNTVFNKGLWRGMSAENTIDLVEVFIRDYGVSHFIFVDDNMWVDKQRMEKIVDGFILKNLNIKWSAYDDINHMDSLDDDTLKKYALSGLYSVFMGLESGSQRILDMIQKGITVKQTLDVNEKLKKHSISPYYFAMVGFQSESEEELKMSAELMVRVVKDNSHARIYMIHCFTPYCGTEMEHLATGHGFTLPTDIVSWRSFGGHEVTVPWIDKKRKKQLTAMIFLMNFIDNKWTVKGNRAWLRIFTKFYQGFARYRFRNLNFSFMIELTLRDIYRWLVLSLDKTKFKNIISLR